MRSVVSGVLLLASAAQAQDQVREGFTIVLDIGVARHTIDPEEGDSLNTFGLAGLNLGLGGFLNQDLAVMFRLIGASVTHDLDGVDVETISGVGGPAVQYWVSPHLNFELGVGIGIARAEASNGFVTVKSEEDGWGFLAAINVPVWWNEGNTLHFGLQAAPVFLEDSIFYHGALVFGWQSL